MNRFICINGAFYDAYDNYELLNIARMISEDYSDALRIKFDDYEKEIREYESKLQELENS